MSHRAKLEQARRLAPLFLWLWLAMSVGAVLLPYATLGVAAARGDESAGAWQVTDAPASSEDQRSFSDADLVTLAGSGGSGKPSTAPEVATPPRAVASATATASSAAIAVAYGKALAVGASDGQHFSFFGRLRL